MGRRSGRGGMRLPATMAAMGTVTGPRRVTTVMSRSPHPIRSPTTSVKTGRPSRVSTNRRTTTRCPTSPRPSALAASTVGILGCSGTRETASARHHKRRGAGTRGGCAPGTPRRERQGARRTPQGDGAGRRGRAVTYTIAEPCVDLLDKACIEECPVDCIYEGNRMLYIHPDECVDCGACEPVCPVEAIFYEDDVPQQWKDYTAANYEF